MRVLVTGATGFLGKRLVRSLVRDEIQVRCLVRGTSDVASLLQFVGQDASRLIEVVSGDLMDEASLEGYLQGCDVVFHCAAGMTGATATIFLNTVVPTRLLVKAVQQAKTPRLVLLSSLGIYGAGVLPKHGTLDENCPIDAKPHLRDSYTFSKVVQEEIVWKAYQEQALPAVVIRPGVIIGPGRGALSNRVGLKVGPLQLRFGNRILPYTYVENCAEAIKQAGLVPGFNGQAFNILDDNLPTSKEVLLAYRQHGRKVRSLTTPQWTVKPMSRLYEWYHHWSKGQLPNVITTYRSDAFWKPLQFSNAKAKQCLNWLPAVPMNESLRRSIVDNE